MLLQILICTIIVVILVTLLIVYVKIIRPEKRIYDAFRAQGIPGEPFVPLIGQLPQLRRYRNKDLVMEFQEDLARRHGNTFLFGFGPITRLVITEPDLLADVLSRGNAQNYIKAPLFSTIFTSIIGKENLLVAEGDDHDRARRMINPAFHHASLKSMISIISDQTAQAIKSILDRQGHDAVDIQVQFNTLTLSIIASCAFGSGFGTLTDAKELICRTFSEVLDALVYRSLQLVNQIPIVSELPFWKKDVVDKGARLIGELVDQIIADRRRGRSTSMCDGADLLDLLLSALDEEGQPFTDQQVKEQALAFVLAGSETTGNLMTWVLYVLMMHDDVLEACRDEIDRVLPNGIDPTGDHLAQLVVCEAVINETLRLYPPAPLFTRYCIREHTIGTQRPLRIPVGATIVVNNYLLHRRGDLWPQPNRFDYTRWMRDPKTGLKPKLSHPFAYLPFAAGLRNCIGQNLALLEAKIMLAMFVQRCHFQYVPGQQIVRDFKITLRSKHGLLLNVRRRSSE